MTDLDVLLAELDLSDVDPAALNDEIVAVYNELSPRMQAHLVSLIRLVRDKKIGIDPRDLTITDPEPT